MPERLRAGQPVRGELLGLPRTQAVKKPALRHMAHRQTQLREQRGRSAQAVVDRHEFDALGRERTGRHRRKRLEPRVDIPILGRRNQVGSPDRTRRNEIQLVPIGQEVDARILIPLGRLRTQRDRRKKNAGRAKLQIGQLSTPGDCETYCYSIVLMLARAGFQGLCAGLGIGTPGPGQVWPSAPEAHMSLTMYDG